MAALFIEAESFDKLGGWVIDQQSIRQMGSPYIMAHGLGVPVADAETVCEVPEDGVWTLWARTRDWTAPWKRGTPGGTFQMLVGGRETPVILGTNGAQWDWQRAGSIPLKKGAVSLALHDLTGFNGRCDALYLTNIPGDVPTNDPDELADLRRSMMHTVVQDDPIQYDLAVAGGGVAGICTAFAAVRLGLKVVLIHDRGVLGGCNSSEIRVGMGGVIHEEPYPNLGNVVEAIQPIMGSGGTYSAEFYEDARKKNIFRLMPDDQYRLALFEHVIAAEKDSDDPTRIMALITRNTRTGAQTRIRARLFADCTGDAVVSRMMGAGVMTGRESRDRFGESLAPETGDRQVMGMSVLWYSKQDEKATTFPDIDWGLNVNEDNAYYIRGGDWEWECGQNRDQADDTEYIRDYGMMAIFANWSYLKNHSKRKEEWARESLAWISPLGGKRESYRVVGDLILTQNDIENLVDYPDQTAAMTWSIDLHFPDPENERKFPEPFRSCAYHRGLVRQYAIPYRCLYARDVKNLFLGGRHISFSHVAFSSVRVMRTLGMLGEVIGMAAAVCIRENADPREIYEKYLDELIVMMKEGVTVPVYHQGSCHDSEFYHFKELGFIRVYPQFEVPVEDRELCERIKGLGVIHKHEHPSF